MRSRGLSKCGEGTSAGDIATWWKYNYTNASGSGLTGVSLYDEGAMDDTSRTRSLRSVRSSLARRAVAACKGGRGREGSRLSGRWDLFLDAGLVLCSERRWHKCALSALYHRESWGLGHLPAATSAASSSPSSSSSSLSAACCCWRCLCFLAMTAPSSSSCTVSPCL